MKTAAPLLAGILTLVAWFAPSPPARALDLTPLAGHYNATCRITSDGNTIVSGDVTITALRIANGDNRVRMKIAGYGAIPDSSPVINVALLGNLTLSKTHRIKADNALLAFYYRLPANSRFAGNHQRLTFRLENSIEGTPFADIRYTLRFNGTKLSIVGEGTVSGSSVTVILRGTKVGS